MDDNQNLTPEAVEPRELRSVASALDLLECFATAQELGVSEIARRLGIAKSTAHRLLSTLRSRGFVEQIPGSARYRLGLHLFELGHLVQLRSPLRQVALPICHDLSRRTGFTVTLAVADSADIVFIERIESAATHFAAEDISWRLPAHVSSSGKAIAAWNPVLAAARQTAGFPVRVRPGVRTLADWEAALKVVRSRGYATSIEESYAGLSSIAVPVQILSAPVDSAIGYVGRSPELEMRLPLLVQLLDRAAKRIAHELPRRLGLWSQSGGPGRS